MNAPARVVWASSFDPFRNLAVEDRLFRNAGPEIRTLYLWVNDPAVVIGRFQNPWLECRLDALSRDGVPFVRRQSGGGAVYHDRGNLCVSFMGPKQGFDRKKNIELVIEALADVGIDAETNTRNDILVQGKKVSGSAYRESGNRSFHHLTLLVDADLDRLSRYLQPTLNAEHAKGVASVRSPVANLRDADRRITVAAVGQALSRRYGRAAGGCVETDAETATADDPGDVAATMLKWTSWEWLFGASPEFSVTLGGNRGGGCLKLAIRGGVIAEATEIEPNAEYRPELLGIRFGPDAAEALRRIGSELLSAGDVTGSDRFQRWAMETEGYCGKTP